MNKLPSGAESEPALLYSETPSIGATSSEGPASVLAEELDLHDSPLRSLAIRAAIWTLVAFGFSQCLRLAGNILLTRFLKPQYFGLAALLTTITTGLILLSDIGLAGC